MAGGSPQTVGRDGPKHRAIHAAGEPTRLAAPHVPRRARATAAPAATRRPAWRARAGPRLGDGDSCSYGSCCTTGTPAPPGALDATARARLLSTPAAAAACYLGAGSTRARHLPGCDSLATTPEALGAPALLPSGPCSGGTHLTCGARCRAPRTTSPPRSAAARLPRAGPALPTRVARYAGSGGPGGGDARFSCSARRPPPMCCNLTARVDVGPHPGPSRPSRPRAGAPLGLRSWRPMSNPLYRRWYGASTLPDCRPGLFYQAAK